MIYLHIGQRAGKLIGAIWRGQWALQTTVYPAGLKLGVDPATIAMAVGWGRMDKFDSAVLGITSFRCAGIEN